MRAERVGLGIAVAGAIAIASATLFPTPGVSAIPHDCIICGQLGGVDAVLNVLLFIPLGLGLGIRRTGLLQALFLIVLTTAHVELLQLTLITGRSATVGDLLTNTIGGSVGYAIGLRWHRVLFPQRAARRLLLAMTLVAFAAIMALTGYSLQPSPTTGTFFGHLTRPYLDEPAFPGTVRLAAVGGCIVTNVTVEDYRCIGSALIRGDTFAVDVAARGTTARPSAIVRVVDERQNEIAALGADRDRAIFSVRTRAAAMGFRPYRFALDSVFGVTPRDVRLAGEFDPSSVSIAADARRIEMRLGPASGWRLFVPFRYFDNGSLITPTLGGAWIAMLLFPIGYWTARTKHTRPTRSEVAILTLILLGSLLICPLLFATAPPSIPEFLGAIAGIAMGIGARTALDRVDDSPPIAHD